MQLDRMLQIAVACLVAFSTALLGMGEQRVALPVAAVIVAFATVYITDAKGWIVLNQRAADAAGVGAALLALFQWQQDATDAGLLALLNFAVYSQFVLQLKRKGIGTYWLLITLSLMEAAVATALNESLMFGFLLVGYAFLAIGVLTVFYLYREQISAYGADAGRGIRESRATSPASRDAHFAGHAVTQQSDEALNPSLARLVANLGGVALGMACLVFVVIPRSERGAWREIDDESAQRIVGFTNEVHLGEMGAISESPEEIMEVFLEDPATNEPCELVDEPLFRGVVLTTYANRKWKRELFHGKAIERQRIPSGVPYIKQRFVVLPLDTDVLFSIFPSFSTSRQDKILWTDVGEQLERRERRLGNTIDYELITTGIVDKRQSSIVPAQSLLEEHSYEQERLLMLPSPSNGYDPLAGSKALAAQIVRAIPAENHLERTRVLANYLRDPTNFRYSLGEISRDPQLDPVEDFLTSNRVGHCEYFASAMAVMLRAVGIPSRLAVGFKGGDWTGRYYQVRAMDAHAWVEAYLAPEYLPERLPEWFDRSKGGWVIIDPTGTVSAAPAMNASSYVYEALRQFTASMRTGWRTYVLGLNHSRQTETIYEPFWATLRSVTTALTHREFWALLGTRLAKAVSPAYWGLTNGGWFSWRGALATIVIMLFFVGVYYAGRFIMRRIWRWTSGDAAVIAADNADVEFYRRLELLLAQRDMLRGPSQTQREFALAVGGQLAESAQTKRAAPIARQLVELFYRVRFGRRTLDSQEAATVEQALADLAGVLAAGNGSQH
jgi:transglutaminase-like putative cysteine protease